MCRLIQEGARRFLRLLYVRRRESAAAAIIAFLRLCVKASSITAAFKRLVHSIEILKARFRCCLAVAVCCQKIPNYKSMSLGASRFRLPQQTHEPRHEAACLACLLRLSLQSEPAQLCLCRNTRGRLQVHVRRYCLVRDARILVLHSQWHRWEAAHTKRIMKDKQFRGAAVASEPKGSVVRDCDFVPVADAIKRTVCQQCALPCVLCSRPAPELVVCAFGAPSGCACVLRDTDCVKHADGLLATCARSLRTVKTLLCHRPGKGAGTC